MIYTCFLVHIFVQLEKDYFSNEQVTTNQKSHFLFFYDKPVMESMFCWPVDSEEIRQLIYNLKYQSR